MHAGHVRSSTPTMAGIVAVPWTACATNGETTVGASDQDLIEDGVVFLIGVPRSCSSQTDASGTVREKPNEKFDPSKSVAANVRRITRRAINQSVVDARRANIARQGAQLMSLASSAMTAGVQRSQ